MNDEMQTRARLCVGLSSMVAMVGGVASAVSRLESRRGSDAEQRCGTELAIYHRKMAECLVDAGVAAVERQNGTVHEARVRESEFDELAEKMMSLAVKVQHLVLTRHRDVVDLSANRLTKLDGDLAAVREPVAVAIKTALSWSPGMLDSWEAAHDDVREIAGDIAAAPVEDAAEVTA